MRIGWYRYAGPVAVWSRSLRGICVRSAITLVVGTAAALTASAAANAKTYRITVEAGWVVRMGPLKVKTHPYLRDASAAFGRPTSVKPGRGICTARWSAPRLTAQFTSFGGISDFCGEGLFQTAVVRSSMWETWAGLRVGMRSARVPELHESAEFSNGKWVLATQDVYGSEPSPTVSALVRGGRVTALSLWVGGAGD
jgi:hypothetical protein